MSNELMAVIGARLKDARIAAGLTQEDVSSHVRHSRQAISSWENGHTLPEVLQLRELAQLYGASMDVLFFGVKIGDVSGGLFDRLLTPGVAFDGSASRAP